MKVTFRLPSKNIQYGYAEVEFELSSTSSEALGGMYAEYALDFQSGEIDAYSAYEQRAREGMEALGGKVVAVETNPIVDGDVEAADQPSHSEKANIGSTPPWEAPAPKAASKPWEAPNFNFGN